MNLELIKGYYFKFIKYLKQPQTWFQALLGTISMELFFRLAPRFRLARIDYFTINGTFLFQPGTKASVVGAVMFYSGAVIWVTLYKMLRNKIKDFRSLGHLSFVIFLFIISSSILSIAGFINPQMRRGILRKPGLLGLNLGGWKTPFSNFWAHIIFVYVIKKCTSK